MAVTEFPHNVRVLGVPREVVRPIPRFLWAEKQFGRDNFSQQNDIDGTVVYSFKKEEDAAFFALKWVNVK